MLFLHYKSKLIIKIQIIQNMNEIRITKELQKLQQYASQHISNVQQLQNQIQRHQVQQERIQAYNKDVIIQLPALERPQVQVDGELLKQMNQVTNLIIQQSQQRLQQIQHMRQVIEDLITQTQKQMQIQQILGNGLTTTGMVQVVNKRNQTINEAVHALQLQTKQYNTHQQSILALKSGIQHLSNSQYIQPTQNIVSQMDNVEKQQQNTNEKYEQKGYGNYLNNFDSKKNAIKTIQQNIFQKQNTPSTQYKRILGSFNKSLAQLL